MSADKMNGPSTKNHRAFSLPEQLIWQEEFDSPVLDQSRFSYSIGNWLINEKGEYVVPGWGNDEMQYYTNQKENIFIKDSQLMIQAIHQQSPKQFGKLFSYTSARIHTKGKFSFQYGRLDIMAKMPIGKGLWPAIWLLPEDSRYGPWPLSGEIDVVETKGRLPYEVYGTLHYGNTLPENVHCQGIYRFSDGTGIQDFHLYTISWQQEAISWYVDNRLYFTMTNWYSGSKDTPFPYPAPFDQKFYLIINLAVGGRFDPVEIDNTRLPAAMEIDFIRVYQ